MRSIPGTFYFLPQLTDAQIAEQVRQCQQRGWGMAIEYTEDAHSHGTYWLTHGEAQPEECTDAQVMVRIDDCRREFPQRYVRVTAHDPSHAARPVVMCFLVNRPQETPHFRLTRTEVPACAAPRTRETSASPM